MTTIVQRITLHRFFNVSIYCRHTKLLAENQWSFTKGNQGRHHRPVSASSWASRDNIVLLVFGAYLYISREFMVITIYYASLVMMHSRGPLVHLVISKGPFYGA